MFTVTHHCEPLAPLHQHPETVTLAQVARKLGLTNLKPRSQIANLRKLADDEGFPLPLNPRRFKGAGQTHSLRIGRRSVWDANAFDRWYDAWRNGAATHPTRQRAGQPAKRSGLHEELARRAAKLAQRS